MCHVPCVKVSKQSNSLGRTKLTNPLGFTLRVSQNSLFPLRPVIKVLNFDYYSFAEQKAAEKQNKLAEIMEKQAATMSTTKPQDKSDSEIKKLLVAQYGHESDDEHWYPFRQCAINHNNVIITYFSPYNANE